MRTEIKRVSNDILTLLNIVHRSISLEEFHYFLDEPYFLINFSLTYLVREGIIDKEFKNQRIYISKSIDTHMLAVSH